VGGKELPKLDLGRFEEVDEASNPGDVLLERERR
jgi:hypothetical protein